VTNAHVVEPAIRDPSTTVFASHGSRRLRARLWSWDAEHDLALLFVKDFYTPLPWWDDRRHNPQVGDFVLAIGSPYGLETSSTTGVISKITKRFIQTDAAVNPGNSGGPLVNRYGEVVGVVSYTLSLSQNINFAVPIEATCQKVLEC
jgi:serine protease Do